MNKSIELVKNSLNNNISNDILKVFKDFELLNSNKKINSLGYLYYNSDFYYELLFYLGLHFLEMNYRHPNLYTLEDFDLGDLVIFNKETYTFLGLDLTNDQKNVILVSTHNGKNSYKNTVPFNYFINNVTKINREKRNNHEKYEDILDFYGIKDPNYKINKQLLILTEKKIIDKLEQTEINLNNNNYKFTSICPTIYINSTGKKDYLKNTSIEKEPLLITFSDIIQLMEYIENIKEITDFNVVVIGNKWLKSSQLSNFYDLIALCDENINKLQLFSNIASAMNGQAFNEIKKLNYQYFWLEPYDKSEEILVNFKFINVNYKLINAFNEFNKFIKIVEERSKNDFRYIHIKRLLYNFLKIFFSQLKGSSETLENYMILVSEYISRVNETEMYYISKIMTNIYLNRYGYDNYKLINEEIGSEYLNLIVVPNELISETKKLYQNKDNVEVISYNERIKTNKYYTYEKTFLLYPSTRDRRKWISAYISKEVYILYPKYNINSIIRSLKNDKSFLEEFYERNSVEITKTSHYFHALEVAISELINFKKMNSEDDDSKVELMDTDDDSREEENLLFNHYNNNIRKIENEYSDDLDNYKVKVTHELKVKNGFIYGTEFGKMFLLDKNEIISEKFISDFEIGDKVVEFSIPYSDEVYRQDFKKLYYRDVHSDELLRMDDKKFFDFYWKSTLLDYLQKNHKSAQDFKNEIEKLYFEKKSIGFYDSWSNIQTIPIVPRDQLFIYKIGELTNNRYLIDYYELHFNASKSLRDHYSQMRKDLLKSLVGKHIDEITDLTHTKNEVIYLDYFEIDNVNRAITNKIWKDEYNDYN